jgi:hypothetical protein
MQNIVSFLGRKPVGVLMYAQKDLDTHDYQIDAGNLSFVA